jgi:hypothetical protein
MGMNKPQLLKIVLLSCLAIIGLIVFYSFSAKEPSFEPSSANRMATYVSERNNISFQYPAVGKSKC